MSDLSEDVHLDEVLDMVCRRYLDGEMDMQPHLLPHICRRLLEFLNPKPPTKKGRRQTVYRTAGGYVDYLINIKGMTMMDARALVGDIMQWPRHKIAQAHRDFRPKKK
ncbi:hypothetical protein QA644_06655 [Rhizobium sp. CC1099]|uniref:hypothetical protein n=1 Tax=Rhizobium sp. CC1099 TaxID=3039160 RepID=UPI0024B17ACC|nr:hypothetical protein [Rhizobium sp. CC1099]WFU88739.1 hypothetical protein QA644_06655 [Rhizobium sp. CC1099]